MIDGTYKIKVQVLFGYKSGKIVLHTEGDKLLADIDVPIIGRHHVEGTVDGDKFSAKGSGMALPLGLIRFNIKGEVSGDDLHLDIKSNKGNLKMDGVRV